MTLPGVKMGLHRLAALILSALLIAGPASAEPRLLMLKEEWCDWCMLWEEEIGGIYDRTEEGRQAPILRADIHDPLPEGVTLARRAHFAPTFVLLNDAGHEVGRIEGYTGADFFFGMVGTLLDRLDTTEP